MSQSALRILMSDGRERTVNDIAHALNIPPAAAGQYIARLYAVGELTRTVTADKITIWRAVCP